MKSKKGVSPVVAVVLLIAVAVTVGMLVTTWITSWVTEQTSKPSLTCAINTNYIIDSARFNYTGNEILLIKITNEGSEELYAFGLILDNGTLIKQFNTTQINASPNVTANNKLKQEQSTYLTLNLSNATTSTTGGPIFGRTLTEVRVTNNACTAVSSKTTTITVYPS